MQHQQFLRLLIIGTISWGITVVGCGSHSDEAMPPSSFKGATIMEAWQQPGKIIAKQSVAAIVSVDTSGLSIHMEAGARGEPGTILYSWPSGKKRRLAEKVEIEEYCSVGLAAPRAISKELFVQQFTDDGFAEKQAMAMAKDTGIDVDIAIAEARYLAAIAKERRIVKIENVGEAAYWEMPLAALHVWVDHTAFTITTNLNAEEKQSRETAIGLAAAIFRNENK